MIRLWISGLKPLDVEAFKKAIADQDVIILDVRDKWEFAKGFIPSSMFIGLDGSFAPWVGALITDIKSKIAIVAPVGREEETVRRLARVGYDNAIGYLKGGFESWKTSGERIDTFDAMSVADFISKYKNGLDREVIDVRKPSEYETTHICGAKNVPLDFFPTGSIKSLDSEKSYYIHCRSGFRSTIAASLLKKNGINNFINVVGDFDEIKSSIIEVEGTCPSLIA